MIRYPTAPLPDGQQMSLGERFQYALRKITVADRAELGRNEKTLRTWRSAENIALDVVLNISAKTGIPISWIVEGIEDRTNGAPSRSRVVTLDQFTSVSIEPVPKRQLNADGSVEFVCAGCGSQVFCAVDDGFELPVCNECRFFGTVKLLPGERRR